MRTVPMCFSIFQVPRFRVLTLANFWRESFHTSSRTCENNFSFKLFGSRKPGLEGGESKRGSRRSISTNTEGGNKAAPTCKPSKIRHEILDGTVTTNTTLNTNRTELSSLTKIQYCDIQQKIADNKDLASLVTVIVFDIETTGLSRVNERIIEIALQDLSGGEGSTFQTLVNPERYVPNPHVHGITTHMVNRPDVPRMEDLIPILLQYIKSRQKPGGYVLLVAHNARCFDVPFLVREFSRSSFEVPEDWWFVDTIPLAREMIKSGASKLPSGTSLQALRDHYGIPLVGSAHRAMSDVKTLSLIFQRLSYDLKLPLSSLVERSFKASDLINNKKKKNSS